MSDLPVTAGDWEAEVERWPWRFASTMSDIPHWYVVRGKTLDYERFDAFAEVIIANGFHGVWTAPSGYQRRDTYLPLGEFQYWRIDNIINRDVLADSNVEPVDEQLRLT